MFMAESEVAFQFLGQHRIMGQGDSARNFDPSESMENAGILCVFPIFHTARLGQKIRRSPQLPLCGVALGETMNILFFRNAYCICFLHLYLRKTFQLYYFHGYWKRHLRSRGIAECLGRDKLYS